MEIQTPQNGFLDPETKKVVEAFQMHFRQKKHDDEESMSILDLLLCESKNKFDPK